MEQTKLTHPSPGLSIIPPHLLLSSDNPPPLESEICDLFRDYCDHLNSEFTILSNPVLKKACIFRRIDATRYSKRGRQKIQTKIMKRLRHHRYSVAVMLTLTIAREDFDASIFAGLTREEAWIYVNKLTRDFIDQLNKERRRRNKSELKQWFWVPEEQQDRHYPHIHIVFLHTTWVLDRNVTHRLWPWGNFQYDRVSSNSVAGYLTKYLTKSEDSDFMQAMIWGHHLRLYSTSRSLPYLPLAKLPSFWRWVPSGGCYQSAEAIADLAREEIFVSGQECLPLRGS